MERIEPTEKNIEVEIRGPLSAAQYEKLASYFAKEGKEKGKKERVLIDYSTYLPGGVEERKKDIRVRVTNGIPEIVVKVGEWGGTEQRKELSMLGKPGEFDTLVEIFGHLGFKKGTLAERKSRVFEYKGIEFALVEVPGHSYYFEAERMAHRGEDTKKITEEMTAVCAGLGLTVFDKRGFFDYIAVLNREANGVFDFDRYVPGDFKKRYGL